MQLYPVVDDVYTLSEYATLSHLLLQWPSFVLLHDQILHTIKSAVLFAVVHTWYVISSTFVSYCSPLLFIFCCEHLDASATWEHTSVYRGCVRLDELMERYVDGTSVRHVVVEAILSSLRSWRCIEKGSSPFCFLSSDCTRVWIFILRGCYRQLYLQWVSSLTSVVVCQAI